MYILTCNSRSNDCTISDGFLWVAAVHVSHSGLPATTRMQAFELVSGSTGSTPIPIDVNDVLGSDSESGAVFSISQRWNNVFSQVKQVQRLLLENLRNTRILTCTLALVVQWIVLACMTCLTRIVIQVIPLCSRTKRVLRQYTRR
jgi:hypothetical protein